MKPQRRFVDALVPLLGKDDVPTVQTRMNYQGIDDPLGIAPFSKEIEQRAVSDETIDEKIRHDKWLNIL